MIDAGSEHFDLSAVPLFPLPNVVLFPRAVLPLHIFEERYKSMTADALEGQKLVAMALLRPGWEKSYYGRPAIEPVVCVGQIVSHERLPDGNYNLLLQGMMRARMLLEHSPGDRLYRMARLEPMVEAAVLEIDLSEQRQQFIDLFAESGPLSRWCLARQFRQILNSAFPTAEVADLIAFNALEDVAFKQSLLCEPDVRRRVDRTLTGLLEMAARTRSSQPGELDHLNLN